MKGIAADYTKVSLYFTFSIRKLEKLWGNFCHERKTSLVFLLRGRTSFHYYCTISVNFLRNIRQLIVRLIFGTANTVKNIGSIHEEDSVKMRNMSNRCWWIFRFVFSNSCWVFSGPQTFRKDGSRKLQHGSPSAELHEIIS